jgi:hypothetical protein
MGMLAADRVTESNRALIKLAEYALLQVATQRAT